MSFKINSQTNSTSNLQTHTLNSEVARDASSTIHDPDVGPFLEISKTYPQLEQEYGCTQIITGLPLINIIQDQIPVALSLCTMKNPQFPTQVMGEKSEYFELLNRFFTLLSLFKNGGNETNILSFLYNCIFVIDKISTEQNNPHLYKYSEIILKFAKLLKTGRHDLLSKNARHFNIGDQNFSNSEKYRIAVKSYQLMNRVIDSHFIISGHTSLRYWNKIEPIVSNSRHQDMLKISKLNKESFQNRNTLSFKNKCTITNLFKNLWLQFYVENDQFLSALKNMVYDDLQQNYLKVIQSREVDKICQVKVNSSSGTQVLQDLYDDSFDQQYVQKNCEVYKQFLPRVLELTQWLLASHENLLKRAIIFKEFHFFIKFGDLSGLEKKLSNLKNFTTKNLEDILFSEIEIFIDQKSKDINLIKNVSNSLTEDNLRSIYGYFADTENYHKKSKILVQSLFEGPLEFAQKCQNDLFIFPPLTVSNSKFKPSLQPAQKNRENTTASTTTITSIPKTTSTQEATPQSFVDEKAVTIHPMLQHLQITRDGAALSLKELRKGCKKDMGIEKTLINAQNQLDDLLCTLLRFVEVSSKPLTRPQVHAFIIDCVTHATLMSEQMLAALCLSCSEKKPEVSHDLYYILLNCKFKAGPLPTHLRQWVQNANKGEILVRDLNECAIGISPLQNLLAKTKLFIEGNNAFSAQELLSDTIEYCKNAGGLVHAMQIQINAAKSKPLDHQKEFADDFNTPFSLLCKDLSEKIANGVKIDQSPVIPQNPHLASIRIAIHSLYDQIGTSGLNNVLNNLLLHLETEMSSHSTLHPIYAHAHSAHVLLLGQMIAEEVLLDRIDHCMLSYTGADHDLFAMAETLRMTDKDFTQPELDFLKKAKAVRQLVRYPENFDSLSNKNNIPILKATLSASLEIAQGQKCTEVCGSQEGYQLISNKNTSQKLQKVLNYIAKEIEVLSSVLAKIINKK